MIRGPCRGRTRQILGWDCAGAARRRRWLEHFQENARPRQAGVESGFPSENATNAKMLERFLSPIKCETALGAAQDGEVAGHIVSVLLAEDLGGDRLHHEPVKVRQLAQIGGRMRIAQR